MFIIVDLPEPEAPMIAMNSPSSIVRLTPRRANTGLSPASYRLTMSLSSIIWAPLPASPPTRLDRYRQTDREFCLATLEVGVSRKRHVRRNKHPDSIQLPPPGQTTCGQFSTARLPCRERVPELSKGGA